MGGLNKFLGLISKTSENKDLYTINQDILKQVTVIDDMNDNRFLDSCTGTSLIK
jgi:hypothetical protein